jgi:hypothetical protein
MPRKNIAIKFRLILLLVVGLSISALAASGLLPKTPPRTNFYFLNFSRDAADSQDAAYALQGLVNSTAAKVYTNSRPNKINHLNDSGKPYTVLSPVSAGTPHLLLCIAQ